MTPRVTNYPKARELANALVEELANLPKRSAERPGWFIADLIEQLAVQQTRHQNTELFEYLHYALNDYQRSWPRLFLQTPSTNTTAASK